MSKRVILITGTPCIGKTTTAKALASKIHADYINLTELAKNERLTLGEDKERNTTIIDEDKVIRRLNQIISNSQQDIIIDGHYAASVVPKELATHNFVLRRDPVELRKIMEKCGFTGRKLWENLAAEILDVCLVDALNAGGNTEVCEIDVSGKTVAESVNEVARLLAGDEKCCVGVVDWISKLEKEGTLDEMLKV